MPRTIVFENILKTNSTPEDFFSKRSSEIKKINRLFITKDRGVSPVRRAVILRYDSNISNLSILPESMSALIQKVKNSSS